MSDGDSIDGLFIEKYFADHTSKLFLVCALITIKFTVFNFILSVTIFLQINVNDQSAFSNLKSILSFNKDIGVGCI